MAMVLDSSTVRFGWLEVLWPQGEAPESQSQPQSRSSEILGPFSLTFTVHIYHFVFEESSFSSHTLSPALQRASAFDAAGASVQDFDYSRFASMISLFSELLWSARAQEAWHQQVQSPSTRPHFPPLSIQLPLHNSIDDSNL
ncbi:hypothetical protein E2P81_ATG09915 [Venturia nashicola]|uniref:Uncharacterized protein n=1 Tax=Venturia nashicola TaxID=86259 RepID=A0A4Z1NR84_9PEZI|nr:hypothetical protein E6O75_ATG10132 [Venturia nashicola]TLD15067.1 hypothetical protein E2P81_ATG09915 [Venturia nashicola]